MKKTIKLGLLIIIILFVRKTCYAQDVIVLKNGDEIVSKVLEITPDQIKYKKWDNVDGPTYTTTKLEVFMIKYKNGSKDVFNNTTNANTQKATNDDAVNVENIARNYMTDLVSRQSGGYLTLTSFEKSNGIQQEEMGQKIYRVEFTLTVQFVFGGFVAGNGLVGYFGNFNVVGVAPSSIYGPNSDAYGNVYRPFPKGDLIRLTGLVLLENTDNGYRVKSFSIKTYTELGLPKPSNLIEPKPVPPEWVVHKLDDKISVKLPNKPIENIKGAIKVFGKDNLSSFIITKIDLVKATGKDSATISTEFSKPEFAKAFTKKMEGYSLGDITGENWKGYHSYNVTATNPDKKTKLYYYMIFIGKYLYTFMTVETNLSAPGDRDIFFNSVMLNK